MKAKMIEDEDVVLGDNLEQLLWEINEFCSPNNQKQEEIPTALENYLKYVAKTGNTVFPWNQVRPLFRLKMLAAIGNFSGEACNNEPFVIERFDQFRAAPFTIQRFAELVTQPNRHYKMKEKFLRGLEKTVLVVSTVEPRSLNGGAEEDSTEDTMSWMSHGENDSMPSELPSDSSIPDLNINHGTIHPSALARVDSISNSNNNPSVNESQPEDKIVVGSSNNDDDAGLLEDSEAGISDTPMPVTIASPALEYNIANNDENIYNAESALKPVAENSGPDVISDAPVVGAKQDSGTTSPDLVVNTTAEASQSEEELPVEENKQHAINEVPEAIPAQSEDINNTTINEDTSVSEEVPMELESSVSIDPSTSLEGDSDSPAEPPAEDRIEPSLDDIDSPSGANTKSQASSSSPINSSSDPAAEELATTESTAGVVDPTSATPGTES